MVDVSGMKEDLNMQGNEYTYMLSKCSPAPEGLYTLYDMS
jgi:hypothetical protein